MRIDDQVLRDVIATGRVVVAGRDLPARDCLSAWQTAACYAHALRRTPNSRDWAAIKPWMSPPRDTRLTADLLAAAREIILAPNVETAADILADWCA